MIVIFVMKLATKDELKEKVKERNERFDTVFKVIDSHKVDCNTLFIRKDIQEREDSYRKEEIAKVREEGKEFRHETMNTVAKIFLTMDAMSKTIVELRELILKK